MIGRTVRTAIVAEAKRLGGEFPTLGGYVLVLKGLIAEIKREMLNETLEEDYETIKPVPVPKTEKIVKKEVVKKVTKASKKKGR